MVFCNILDDTFIKCLTVVTILILIDGFLQYERTGEYQSMFGVTILILIDGFLQLVTSCSLCNSKIVTILILIDGFLQSEKANQMR